MRPIEGTADILALTGASAYLTYLYSQIDEVAAWTMVPYLGWLTFASYLAVSLSILNSKAVIRLISRRLALVISITGILPTKKLITPRKTSRHPRNTSTKLQNRRKVFELTEQPKGVSFYDISRYMIFLHHTSVTHHLHFSFLIHQSSDVVCILRFLPVHGSNFTS